MVNGSKHYCNLNGCTFTTFIQHFDGSCLEKSLKVIHKILRLLVNTLTPDDKHYLLNRNNLVQSIQIQLSEKEKKFSEFFFAFLKSIINFKHITKKMTLIADVFWKIAAPKTMVRLMSKMPCYRRHLDREDEKWVERMLQSE